MTEEEYKLEQEHKDFLRKIADEVYELVRNPANMAHFRKQIKMFCEKGEEYQKPLEQQQKDYESNPDLQKAWDRVIKEDLSEGCNCSQKEWELNELGNSSGKGLLKGYEEYVYYNKKTYSDYIDHTGGFWGLKIKAADLLKFLLSSTYEHSCYWQFDLSQKPTEEERLLCCYALLICVHDSRILEKRIFSADVYSGSWKLQNKWIDKVWYVCKGDDWESDFFSFEKIFDKPGLRKEFLDRIKSWIQRALADVKEDLAKIELRKGKKRGRKKKYTDEQVKQMQSMYDKTYYETNNSKGSWGKVAKFYHFPSPKAAEMYCRRNLKRQNK